MPWIRFEIHRHRWIARQSPENKRMVVLLDMYFSRNPHPGEMRAWGNFLCDFDTHGIMWEKILHFLERSGGYNLLLDYFRMRRPGRTGPTCMAASRSVPRNGLCFPRSTFCPSSARRGRRFLPPFLSPRAESVM